MIPEPLNDPHLESSAEGICSMARPRRRVAPRKDETVGDRIRRLRKLRGLSQTELGERVGLTQRQMTYYEAQGGSLSAELLVRFAEALQVSADELLGIQGPRSREAADADPKSVRLWRHFSRVEELPPHDRKSILKMIDALADRRIAK